MQEIWRGGGLDVCFTYQMSFNSVQIQVLIWLFKKIFFCRMSRSFTSKGSSLNTSVSVVVITVEPRFNEPLFDEVLDITNDILRPGQSYSKMYGKEPRYNEFFDITNIIRKPKRKIYLDITNYNVSTQQKINAEQINSQQMLRSLW